MLKHYPFLPKVDQKLLGFGKVAQKLPAMRLTLYYTIKGKGTTSSLKCHKDQNMASPIILTLNFVFRFPPLLDLKITGTEFKELDRSFHKEEVTSGTQNIKANVVYLVLPAKTCLNVVENRA